MHPWQKQWNRPGFPWTLMDHHHPSTCRIGFLQIQQKPEQVFLLAQSQFIQTLREKKEFTSFGHTKATTSASDTSYKQRISDFWIGKFPAPFQRQPRLSPAAVAQSSTSEEAPDDENLWISCGTWKVCYLKRKTMLFSTIKWFVNLEHVVYNMYMDRQL